MLIVAWYCIISGLIGDKLFQSISVVCSAIVLDGSLVLFHFQWKTAIRWRCDFSINRKNRMSLKNKINRIYINDHVP